MAGTAGRSVIASVERCGPAQVVYNLHVEKENNFFAEGVLVHNCLDDPHNIAEAESQAVLRATIDWHDLAFFNRLNDAATGARVVVGQRVGMSDLIGHLKARGGWESVRLPEEFEAADPSRTSIWADWRTVEGELLRPERFGQAQITEAKATLGSVGYATQHQQRPRPREGALFKGAWFRRYLATADHYRLSGTRIVRHAECWRFTVMDPAGGESSGADFTAIGTFAVTPVNELLLLDMVRERIPIEGIAARLKAVCDVWRPKFAAVESDFLQSRYAKQAAALPGMVPVRQVSVEGKDKYVRAIPAVVKAEGGMIYLPESAPWLPAWLDEHLAFTGREDAHDDQVDVTSHAVHLLAQPTPDRVRGWRPKDVVG